MRILKKLTSILVSALIFISIFTAGCGNEDQLKKLESENSDLRNQIESLEKEKEALDNKVAMYVPKEQTSKSDEAVGSDQPVKVAHIQIGPSAGGASVDVSLNNTAGKNIDAIEFVVLQFDNFGKPSNRFNDASVGNVTNKLTVQGNAAPGATLQGSWTLFNMEKSRKAKVIVSQVHFTDGAVWTNKNFDADVAREKESFE